MQTTPPPGDSAIERTNAFLEIYTPTVLQYHYLPDVQWNLATDDVRQLLAEHQEMRSALVRVKDYLEDEQMRKTIALASLVSFDAFWAAVDKAQHKG